VIFAGIQDALTKDEIHDRLKVFEKVRLRRVSAMQILSDAGQDRVFEVRERAQQYMPDGVKVPSSQQEFWDHNFGYDILADTRRHLQAYLKGLDQ
jgi:salicylate hydroxylase